MVYNLLNKANITTSSGNKSLTASEIEKLHNYNTISSGITLVNSNILSLEVDLGNRHPVDSITIHSTATTSSGITVHYKEAVSDSYTLLTLVSGSAVTISTPFNPRYIMTTFSGLDIDLHEIAVLSNLYDVSFGTEGKQSVLDMGETDYLSYGSDSTELPVYNDGLTKKKIYLDVNYHSDYLHDQLLISNTNSSGTFYKSTYDLFTQGELATGYTISGSYTSPIFMFDDVNKVSYIDVVSDDNNITVYARSSNISPMPYYEASVFMKYAGYKKIHKYDIASSKYNESSSSTYYGSNVNSDINGLLVNNEGYVFSFSRDYCYIHDRLGNYLTGLPFIYVYNNYNPEFCGDGVTAWGYDITTGSLNVGTFKYNNIRLINSITTPNTSVVDFIRDFSVTAANSSDVWYIDSISNTVYCIDIDGDELIKVVVESPQKVCAGEDFCWIADYGIIPQVRLLRVGLSLSTDEVYLDIPAIDIMCYNNNTAGFFFSLGSKIYKYDTVNGMEFIGIYFTPESIEYISEEDHLILSNSTSNQLVVIAISTGKVVAGFGVHSGANSTYGAQCASPKVYYKEIASGAMPRVEDTVWSQTVDNDWYPIEAKGGRLKKYKYHQFKVVMNTQDYSVGHIKHGNILDITVNTKEYNSFYVRCHEVFVEDYGDYEAMLTVHWEDIGE